MAVRLAPRRHKQPGRPNRFESTYILTIIGQYVSKAVLRSRPSEGLLG